ncbi:DUF4177 domain-containing protein [Tropicimonas sp. S265A]|uniref:DUF4177 domain-containing protein n=1 Tax=Tropicimonas sp. S265A TaxID=3415134 RepID=UPI003C7DC37E
MRFAGTAFMKGCAMYEYKIRPAPVKGQKAKGLRTSEDRFAHALELAMNEMAQEGWEYVRAETLPAEERVGLTSRSTRFHNMLVFRRALPRSEAETAPVAAVPVPVTLPEPDTSATEGTLTPQPKPQDATTATSVPTAPEAAHDQPHATPISEDPGAQDPKNKREVLGLLRTIKGDRSTPRRGADTDPLIASRD